MFQLKARKEEALLQNRKDLNNLKELIERNKRSPTSPVVRFPFLCVQTTSPVNKFEIEKDKRKILISSQERMSIKGDFQVIAEIKETDNESN